MNIRTRNTNNVHKHMTEKRHRSFMNRETSIKLGTLYTAHVSSSQPSPFLCPNTLPECPCLCPPPTWCAQQRGAGSSQLTTGLGAGRTFLSPAATSSLRPGTLFIPRGAAHWTETQHLAPARPGQDPEDPTLGGHPQPGRCLPPPEMPEPTPLSPRSQSLGHFRLVRTPACAGHARAPPPGRAR